MIRRTPNYQSRLVLLFVAALQCPQGEKNKFLDEDIS